MRILQVIPSLDLGGAETMCCNLACELKKDGHDVMVVCFYKTDSALHDRLTAADIEVIDLEKKGGFDVSAITKIRKIIKTFRPDAVHGHLYVLKYIIPAKFGLGRIKVIHTLHNIAEKESTGSDKIVNKIAYRIFKVVPVGLSPFVCESIERVYGVKDVKLIYNGVPLEKCIPKKDYTTGKNIIICNIARFNEQKNHQGLIKAFKLVHDAHPEAVLQLIGGGELRPECEELVSQLGLSESVIFEGLKGNVYPYLNKADIFALPSLYEGMPMTLIEAMGTGLPIVASPVGGVVDMLEDKRSCLFCGTDAESIAECINKFCDNPELRRSCGINAKQDSILFSSMQMCKEYTNIYI